MSVFYTDWDNFLYRVYDNDSTYNYIDGVYSGLTEKTLFGSKVLKL
jgi:hypothetical protein